MTNFFKGGELLKSVLELTEKVAKQGAALESLHKEFEDFQEYAAQEIELLHRQIPAAGSLDSDKKQPPAEPMIRGYEAWTKRKKARVANSSDPEFARRVAHRGGSDGPGTGREAGAGSIAAT